MKHLAALLILGLFSATVAFADGEAPQAGDRDTGAATAENPGCKDNPIKTTGAPGLNVYSFSKKKSTLNGDGNTVQQPGQNGEVQ